MHYYLKRLSGLFRVMRVISSVYGRGSRMWLWIRMILTVAQPRLPRALRAAQKLDLVMGGIPFSVWMLDRTGLAAFEEVFIRGEYAVPEITTPKVIIDAGANIGVASVYFCVRYPGVRLYAIEPDAQVCDALRQNLAAYPNSSVHECAFSDIDGAISFYIHPTSSIASSLQSRASGEKIISVQSRTLDTFMKEQEIREVDLFKFDIEGAEEHMLLSIKNRHVVHCYVGEIHTDLMRSSLSGIESLFSGFIVRTKPVGEKRFLLTAFARA